MTFKFNDGDKVKLARLRESDPDLDPANGSIGDVGFIEGHLADPDRNPGDFHYYVDLGGEAHDAFYEDELEAVDE